MPYREWWSACHRKAYTPRGVAGDDAEIGYVANVLHLSYLFPARIGHARFPYMMTGAACRDSRNLLVVPKQLVGWPEV